MQIYASQLLYSGMCHLDPACIITGQPADEIYNKVSNILKNNKPENRKFFGGLGAGNYSVVICEDTNFSEQEMLDRSEQAVANRIGVFQSKLKCDFYAGFGELAFYDLATHTYNVYKDEECVLAEIAYYVLSSKKTAIDIQLY
jgi:hypothetical protein